MTTTEFKKAFEVASGKADLSHASLDPFNGFGLSEFERVFVTVAQVARLIRWQAQLVNGGWDNAALTEVAEVGRRKFAILAG